MAGLLQIRLVASGRFVEHPDEFLGLARQALNAELIQGALFLQGKIQRATPVGATGALRRGWHTVPDGEGRVAIANAQEYLLPVEEGRKAAPVPIAPLELWVRRKLGIKRPESFRVAERISWKKARSRTPGQNFVYQAISQNLPALERVLLQKIGAHLQAIWGSA